MYSLFFLPFSCLLFFVSHAAVLCAAVDRDWAEKIFLPYDKLLTNGRVVHGTALTV